MGHCVLHGAEATIESYGGPVELGGEIRQSEGIANWATNRSRTKFGGTASPRTAIPISTYCVAARESLSASEHPAVSSRAVVRNARFSIGSGDAERRTLHSAAGPDRGVPGGYHRLSSGHASRRLRIGRFPKRRAAEPVTGMAWICPLQRIVVDRTAFGPTATSRFILY